MGEILRINTRKLLKPLLVITLLMLVSLAAADRLQLMCGIGAGYFVGFAWYGVMLGRLWRSSEMTAAQAKSVMAVGLVLRLMLLGAVLWASIHVSIEQFAATVTGFGLVYVLGLLVLIHTSYSKYLSD